MFLHESIGDLAVFTECAGRADLIETHEPRVARDVSRDYGGEPAFDTGWLLLVLHSLTCFSTPHVRRRLFNPAHQPLSTQPEFDRELRVRAPEMLAWNAKHGSVVVIVRVPQPPCLLRQHALPALH